MTQDPFSDPADVASEFASVASFRGRLVLIEPTGYEFDVPNQEDPSKKSDRITATITTVDGKGRVEIMPFGNPSGKYIEGPEHKGVWISQDRLVKLLLDNEERGRTKKMVLGRFETYKPGQRAMKGNPWGILKASEADKQTAREFLANRMIGEASAPAEPTDGGNPFS